MIERAKTMTLEVILFDEFEQKKISQLIDGSDIGSPSLWVFCHSRLMPWIEMISLMAAACVAGVINAVAGGGTLITFPVLILFGMNPVEANATSALSLVIGTSGSIYGFRKHISEIRPWLASFIPVSLAGGFLGSFLLTHGSASSFARLVPYLVLFATVLFMIQGVVRRRVAHHAVLGNPLPSGRRHLIIAITFQLLVSVYGGYFGAGIGILMLATLGFLGFSHIHQMNALKNVLGSLINLVAAIWFTVNGLIDWPCMAVMTVGAVAGYYIGATYSQRLSQEKVRYLITAIGLIITVAMFWKLR
jgi:uncharacterized membrane protein YfcA